MKRYALLAVLLTVFNIVTATAADAELPPPPKGYSWAQCPEIKGAFLCPSNWHFKKSKQGETLGFFISKEEIKTNGQFRTGMTVTVIPNIPTKKGMSPYKYALQYRESARTSVTLTKEWEKDMGPFKSVGFVFSRNDKAGAYTVHNLVIANDKTGTFYIVIFEAPATEWNEAWKIAEPMLRYLFIDDTI